MDGKQDYDVLGFIYEYLISMFAANAEKKQVNSIIDTGTINMDYMNSRFEKSAKRQLPQFKVNRKVDELLRMFLISGGFDLTEDDESDIEY